MKAEPKWWLAVGKNVAVGPFWKREINTNWKRFRIIRRHSSLSVRAAWRCAKENSFTR